MNSHITAQGSGQGDAKELRAQVEQLNKTAFERWNDPTWRAEMAAEVTETIYEGFAHENLLSLIANVENATFDGRVFVKEVRGLRAFWVARGGYIEASTMRSDVMELPRDTVGFHVTEFEDKLMTNFAETQANLIDLGIQRLDAEVNARALALFQASIGNSSDYYIGGAGLDLSAVNAGLREVRDASRSQKISIVGRATMTDQIIDELQDSNLFIPQTNEDLVRRGVLGTYRGAQIVTLTNYLDDNDEPFWPANELYIVGEDASKFAFWGGLMSKEFSDNDNWYWHYLARRDFGGVVHRPDRLRRVVDTSIAA